MSPRFGGLYLIKDGRVRVFDERHNLPIGQVPRVAAGADGRLWLASGRGLHVLEPDGEKWRSVEVEMNIPKTVFDVEVDPEGTVWGQSASFLYAMRRGESRFTPVGSQDLPGSLLLGPGGVVWNFDPNRPGVRRLTPGPTSVYVENLLKRLHYVRNPYIDRQGNFWFPHKTGVLRIALDVDARPHAQGFTPRQGLSGRDARLVFEDREGNIWLVTESGLDQFRRGRMREIALPAYGGEARPLAAGPDGALWIDHSFLLDVNTIPEHFAPERNVNTVVHQIYRDPGATVWYGTHSRLWRLDGLKRIQVPLPPEVERLVQQPIYAMAKDADGGLWISLGPRGPWRMKTGSGPRTAASRRCRCIRPRISWPAPTANIVAGPDRRLWFGSVGNGLAILRDGKVDKIGAEQGIDVGTVLAILPDARGAWLGGDEGLAYFDGKRAVRIQGEGGEQFQGGTGLVLAADGGLWVNGSGGLAFIAAADLRRALADPAYRVRFLQYDENDGLMGAPAPMYPIPSMVQTPLGDLVISTTGGVFNFNPLRSVSNRVVPPVHVTGVSIGRDSYPLGATVTLPAAPENVRIDYTALSLSLPRRVRFQYILEGVDSAWQDAGNRRSAFYTPLAPGAYTFRVKAANDDGVWNEEGARVRIEIPPTMAQTWAFKLACALAFILAAYGLHRLRLRMAIRRLSRMFDARVIERERIARDLHDTLLQSVQGLIMHFRRIAMRTPDDAPTRPLMQEALALATEVLEEGRDKVGGLRTAQEGADLAAMLDAHGRRLSAQHGVAFALEGEGAPRRLRAPVLDEVLAIGREAVRNAFLHAEANRIAVALRYGEREFELGVSDDGIGIDEAGRAGRAGHWGMPGMRERAAELGASLDLDSAPGKGCVWRLRLPARLAYDDTGGQAPAAASTPREDEVH
ncbi:sensor histidine kinase [Massilia arenae]|uniref:Histidine kinase/HSP90-like ATPase domain-containing protein n=1 Tax=Massilia arenae TaxID=2603288 RepID=A0A5C7G482_9BURK|nr:sensor histidine kinase [Massilia arenae]TXF99057.1 hypothetical protein FVD38_14775 [Massilia arenae]